jgi:low temperature requirement protein LtrA
MRNHRAEPWILEQLKRKALIIIGEASLILVHMLVYHRFGISIAYVPILFGLAATLFSRDVNSLIPVDFSHLSERAMLYVVFTFGEMIISITGYFEDKISLNTLYFSGMAFLIVVGLFLSYEVFYNRIVDREITTNGTGYMMIHVFLIFALNNISVALDFMRKEEVAILPKTLFITGSFILYFVFLFLADIYAKKQCACNLKYHEFIGVLGLSFLILMIVFRTQMTLNIAISVVYVFTIFLVIYRKGKSVSVGADSEAS